MRLPALAAAILLAACGSDKADPELEKIKAKREEEIRLLREATKPKPPEAARPAPSKDALVARCKADSDFVACQGACALDDWESCYQTGLVWEEGRGVPKPDYDAARRFHERACNEGSHGQACYAAGIFFDYGKSVPKNPRKAKEYFQRACDLKIDAGCRELKPK